MSAAGFSDLASHSQLQSTSYAAELRRNPCADSPVCPVPLTVWNNTPASGPRFDTSNLHSVLWALCFLTVFDVTIISIQRN